MLNQMVVLFFPFLEEPLYCFPRFAPLTVAPLLLYTNSVQGFQFLHILAKLYLFYSPIVTIIMGGSGNNNFLLKRRLFNNTSINSSYSS